MVRSARAIAILKKAGGRRQEAEGRRQKAEFKRGFRPLLNSGHSIFY